MTDTEQEWGPNPGDRRDPSKGRMGDRRRGGWRDFRRTYPGFVFTLLIALAAMIALDALLFLKHRTYGEEVARLQSSMTAQERSKAQAIIAAEQNKTRIALELARRQAKLAKVLHLSVSIDSGRIYLERDGAILREMPAAFGPETKVGPDSIPVVVPRGETTLAKMDDDKLTLKGGTLIGVTDTDSPELDTAPVPPGSVRIRRADLKAIMPNLVLGMSVYFY